VETVSLAELPPLDWTRRTTAALGSTELSELDPLASLDDGLSPASGDTATSVSRERRSRDDGDSLRFFPDVIDERAEPSDSAAPLVTTADGEIPTDDRAEPNALDPSLSAAPIDPETRIREQVTRSIIAEELPEATQQEREIWFDVLRGLAVEDVKGILGMRKHVGGPQTSRSSLPLPRPETFPRPESPADLGGHAERHISPVLASWRAAVESWERVKQAHLHNLANVDTIAFKRWVPVLQEASPADARGAHLSGIELDMSPGELIETGRPFDLALTGDVFFLVRQGSVQRVTRRGRLTLDDGGRLVIRATGGDWIVEPEIEVPHDVRSLTVTPQGLVRAISGQDEVEREVGQILLVRVLNPSALAPAGEGAFETTAASGPALPLPAGDARGTAVRQGFLERSNVDAAHEWAALRELERLEQEVCRAATDARASRVSDVSDAAEVDAAR
jgi:flagellar basal body rod protein FlgG